MNRCIRELVEIVAETLPISQPIFEFGSFLVPAQRNIADLRPLFPNRKYVGCDMREGPGVDRVLDLHDIALPSESVGTVLLFDTLEHVEFPHRALEEVFRILQPNGLVAMSSVMDFPIHNYPQDYWRFTPEAFRSLLRRFPQSLVDSAGPATFPHTIVGLGFKGSSLSLEPFVPELEKWKRRWWDRDGKSWAAVARRIAPPLLVDVYRKSRGPLLKLLEKIGVIR